MWMLIKEFRCKYVLKLDMRYLPDGGIEVRNGAIKLGIIKESLVLPGGIKMPPAEVKIILFM